MAGMRHDPKTAADGGAGIGPDEVDRLQPGTDPTPVPSVRPAPRRPGIRVLTGVSHKETDCPDRDRRTAAPPRRRGTPAGRPARSVQRPPRGPPYPLIAPAAPSASRSAAPSSSRHRVTTAPTAGRRRSIRPGPNAATAVGGTGRAPAPPDHDSAPAHGSGPESTAAPPGLSLRNVARRARTRSLRSRCPPPTNFRCDRRRLEGRGPARFWRRPGWAEPCGAVFRARSVCRGLVPVRCRQGDIGEGADPPGEGAERVARLITGGCRGDVQTSRARRVMGPRPDRRGSSAAAERDGGARGGRRPGSAA